MEQIIELLRDSREAVQQLESLAIESESTLAQLDQSTLAKAFRGKLVPQDPSDEPASALLARIKAEREVDPIAGKRTPRKKKSSKKAPSRAG
jgi:type I restriction enzyme S subunit